MVFARTEVVAKYSGVDCGGENGEFGEQAQQSQGYERGVEGVVRNKERGVVAVAALRELSQGLYWECGARIEDAHFFDSRIHRLSIG